MGRYRLGDTIRMTRRSLSITQEQLCDGICSTETLSRMESGRQNPSKEIYELLMERMGRIRDRGYSMLSASDFKVLEKMKQFSELISNYNYQQGEEVLKEIKSIIGDTVLDRQFLIRSEGLIDYRLNRISVDQFIKKMEDAITLTIPRYSTISIANWPLNYIEYSILLNMSTAYAENEDYPRAISIIEDIKSALRQSYIDEELRNTLVVIIDYNLSKWYGLQGKHEAAIKLSKDRIEICREYRLGHVLPNLLYNISWNQEQLIEKEALPTEHKIECLEQLKQAYYIALALQQPFVAQFIKDHTEKVHHYQGLS